MKIVRYISICLLFTFIGSLLPTKAQDNPYKIDHSLYLLYEEATKHRNNATGLEIADTIYTKAIRINDKKAQCLALTIPVIYYFNNGKTELLEKAISRLQEISRKNNYLQYYYFGSIYKVNYLMNTGNTLRALQEAELTKEQAFADDYPLRYLHLPANDGKHLLCTQGKPDGTGLLPTIAGIHTGEAP